MTWDPSLQAKNVMTTASLAVRRTDPKIAHDVARALKLVTSPADDVRAVVHNARVTLTGTVQSSFQKAMAAYAVRDLRGVEGVNNRITVNAHGRLRHRHR